MFLEKSFKIETDSVFGIYSIFTIHSILWTKSGSLSARWTLGLGKADSKYFVLGFYSKHGLFGRNLYSKHGLFGRNLHDEF